MNIYFDTEFTGLVPNTTLISIGCVSEGDRKFYAEFMDYNEDLCDDWIKENVLTHRLLYDHFSMSELLKEDIDGEDDFFMHNFSTYINGNYTLIRGDTEFIRGCFVAWLHAVNWANERIQFVSDVSHYDFYLLCNQIFGGAFNLPDNVNPVCYDICQDICARYETPGIRMPELKWFADMDYMYDAFDVSREKVCKKINGYVPEGNKHNALYDAEVIKLIYEGMRGIK